MRGRRFAWPSEGFGSELDGVALFELGDELVGAEGGVGAGGLAEGGGLKAGEGGEAFLPVRWGGPAALELGGVEPDGRRFQAEVGAGGGPAVVSGGGGEASPDGVDIAEGGGPVGVVEDAGEEAPLPEVAAPFLSGVAVAGVLAIDVHHEEGDGVRAIAGGDQVEVVGHERVRGDASAALH